MIISFLIFCGIQFSLVNIYHQANILIYVNHPNIIHHSVVLKVTQLLLMLELSLEKLLERQIKQKLAQMGLQNSISMPV